MKRILIGITVLFLGAATNTNAQKYWTLEECIRHAQEKNITIKRKELVTDASQNTLFQRRMNLLPNLGAGADHNISSGRSLNMEEYKWENAKLQQGSLGISSELVLFNGFQNLNSIQKAKYDLMMNMSELDKAKNDISINIAIAYLAVLFEEELLEVAKSQHDLSLLQVERNKKLVDVGNIARGNLLEIKAQAASEKVSVTNAENNLKIAYLNLTQMLELDSIGDFRVFKPDTLTLEDVSPLLSVREIYNQALLHMPDIKSSEYSLKSTEKELAMARGRLSPTITLSGLYYSRYNEKAVDILDPTSNYSYMAQIKDNQYKQVSLNLSVPIFTRFSTKTQISNTKILVEDAEYSLIDNKKALYKSIQQAHADAVNAYQNFISRREAVLSSEEAFKYTQQKYEVGLSSAVDFNIAKNNLTKANSDLLQSKYEYIFKNKILDFYRGVALKI
jgi:outer membrane protein